MFPLGTVLVPGAVLPLHVFEPRYRQLMQDVLAGDREFGVVLIERGSEVGGGDQRSDAGTLARVAEAEELPDGRWAVAAIGVERFRVERWLDDDPYPRAEIESWPDEPAGGVDRWPETHEVLRAVLALKAELGRQSAPATLEFSPDPILRSYQALAVSGLGPLDAQSLLACAGPDERLERLGGLLVEERAVLEQLLSGP